MEKLHFSIVINAPTEKVWHAMLDDDSYREWTSVFNEGSYYEGSWDKGSKILFLGPDPTTGKLGGMVSEIAENRPYEFISIKHLGLVNDGVEDTESEEAKKWAPAYENYTFKEVDGGTEVLVDLETDESMAEEFGKMWPAGLEQLKKVAER